MATAQEIIRYLMDTLDSTQIRGKEALNSIVRVAGYADWQAVIDSMCNDCRTYAPDDFLKYRCGIILGNADTGSIGGSDASGGPTKTAESIVPENDTTWRLPETGSTTYSEFGLTVNWPNLYSLTASQQRIISGLYTWWIPESLRLIRDSYGYTFNEPGTTVNTISQVNFINEDSSKLASVHYRYNLADGHANALELNINMKYYDNVSVDVNGKAGDQFYLDRVIAHEMTHAVMAANINWFGDLPLHFKEGIAELVHGVDDERKYAIELLAKNPNYLQQILTLDATSESYEYAAGYMLLRYLAHQVSGSASVPPAPTPEAAGSDTTVKKYTVNSAGSYWLTGYDPLSGVSGTAYPNCKELDGSGVAGELILAGNAKDNLIKGGTGYSSLWGGGASNDTLQGGSGRDMIWFGAGDGNDRATSFAAGIDVLNLYSGSLSSVTRSGSSLTLTLGDGSVLRVLTDQGADSSVLYSVDATNIFSAKIGESSKGSRLTYEAGIAFYQGGSGNDTLRASGSSDKLIWLDGSQGAAYSSIEIIDGSASSGADQLAGSGAEELILGGNGEASLWGGAGSGNDTLQAGTGNNVVFYGYGEGSDVIKDTTDGDRVMLYNIGLGHVTAASVGASEVSVNTTAGQTLKVYGTAGTFTLGDGSSWRPDRQNGSWQKV